MSLILLTNDDGVNSPGLLALKEALDAVGEVVVFAPEHNWSAAGHRKTMHKPLRVQEAPLADGGRWFDRLVDGPRDVAKVLLIPQEEK